MHVATRRLSYIRNTSYVCGVQWLRKFCDVVEDLLWCPVVEDSCGVQWLQAVCDVVEDSLWCPVVEDSL